MMILQLAQNPQFLFIFPGESVIRSSSSLTHADNNNHKDYDSITRHIQSMRHYCTISILPQQVTKLVYIFSLTAKSSHQAAWLAARTLICALLQFFDAHCFCLQSALYQSVSQSYVMALQESFLWVRLTTPGRISSDLLLWAGIISHTTWYCHQTTSDICFLNPDTQRILKGKGIVAMCFIQ